MGQKRARRASASSELISNIWRYKQGTYSTIVQLKMGIFKVAIMGALVCLAAAAPAKLDQLQGNDGYNYEAPAQPSNLYDPPAVPSDLYETPNDPPPPPPTTTTTTTTTTTPPPPPPDAYLPPVVAESKPSPIVADPPRSPPAMMKKMDGPYMPYVIGWDVDDEETENNFSHKETATGNEVTGEYRVLLPDGRTQVVSFRATPETGYVANVSYE